MKYVIGIDGGGTKTSAVLLDQNGRELGRGRSGAANPNTMGRDAATTAARHAIQTALMTAARGTISPPTLEEVAGICMGMAGATGATAWLEGMLASMLPAAMVISSDDAEIALVGALGARRGMVAIAGTGSIVYGIGQGGQQSFTDGWGYLLGDEASGFAIGRAAVMAYLRTLDGRTPANRLTQAVAEHLGFSSRDEVIAWGYPRDGLGHTRVPVPEIADLAPTVLHLAQAGEPHAQAIIEGAADALMLSIRAVWHKLELGACRIGLVGGVLYWDGPMARAVISRMAQTLPSVTPSAPQSDAATGAAWLAMQALGWRSL